jgi:hypothetical protein
MMCVQCRDDGDCQDATGTFQICDPTAHTCGACTRDEQCMSGGVGLCVDGRCPVPNVVAFADCAAPSCPGDGQRATPFCAAQAAIDRQLLYTVLVPHDSTSTPTCSYQPIHVSIPGRKMIVLGGNATLGAHATLNVASGQDGVLVDGGDVTVRDLEITTSRSDAHHGAHVLGRGARLSLEGVKVHDMYNSQYNDGVLADMADGLTVRRSLIYRNRGWGIEIRDTHDYDIENSMILVNGDATQGSAYTGGVRLTGIGTGQGSRLFLYNTVAKNVFVEVSTMDLRGAGVQCEIYVPIQNSLLIDNRVNGSSTLSDVTSMCDIVAGTIVSNMATPPLQASDVFMHWDDPEATTPGDPMTGYHLKQPVNRLIWHQAAAVASPVVDFDGDPRPGMPTPGADEPM